MNPMMTPERQKAELHAAKRQLEANLAVAREQAKTLASAMDQFRKAADSQPDGYQEAMAAGMNLFAGAQKFAVDSNIVAMTAQCDEIEKVLTRMGSPVHIPIMSPPYPGGRR
jgi:hypothetical protein